MPIKSETALRIPAIIYARYSSHNQNGAPIERQVAECETYAKAIKLRMIDTHVDRAISDHSDGCDRSGGGFDAQSSRSHAENFERMADMVMKYRHCMIDESNLVYLESRSPENRGSLADGVKAIEMDVVTEMTIAHLKKLEQEQKEILANNRRSAQPRM